MSRYTKNLNVYLVGGAVRDRLLGKQIKDRDWVVVGAIPDEMLRRGFKAVGKDFPVFLHPETHEEYALARTERKLRPGYTGFQFDTSPEVSLQQDLARRDLTINAIAQTETGELIDPFGGAADLRHGVLRHVSAAFMEDPVRVLRVARFVARYEFRIAAETLALMKQMVSGGEVDALVAERIWSETQRALEEKKPALYCETLRQCGALAKLFPEIDVLFGVPQPPEFHPEGDTGIHTLMVLEQAARLTDNSQVRFAALVHDLGKGLTPKSEWPRHIDHEKRGLEAVKGLCHRLRVPNTYRDLALIVCRYHLDLHRIRELKPATVVKMLQALDAFRKPGRAELFLLACEADYRGRTGYEDRPYPQARVFRQCLLAATAVDAKDMVAADDDASTIAREIRERRVAAVARVNYRDPKRSRPLKP